MQKQIRPLGVFSLRKVAVPALAATMLLGHSALGQGTQSPDNTILQNKLVRLEFSARDGILAQITDLKTGYEWLSPAAPRRLPDLDSNRFLRFDRFHKLLIYNI